ncbi:EamA family transporter [Rhizobiales bacterium RZME27]|uniref:EamA family transporter n=1 Tax=Endobacterium cereale TaxID=2663029 RepID=A0A6A8ALV4_9HYPH|nr:DMT family transporter [Endobacterium cereale]MEB2845706.1 DMT family transporter [Endobacterium cereale]MQY50136.1 EamA family transporter [Endobacterium cereale]
MLIGILAGLGTCALWGLTFVAPRAVEPFTAWDLTVARYGIFGAACLLLMLDERFRPTGISASRIAVGLLLGGCGYVGYFVCAAYAVTLAGTVIPPLVIGLMPVLTALVANHRERAMEWRDIALPLTMICLGLLVANLQTITSSAPPARHNVWLGTLLAIAALFIWIAYGLANAKIMRRPDAPESLRWTGLQGIGAAFGSAMLLPLTDFHAPGEAFLPFAIWAVVMGLAGSWLATWLWVIASRRLPLALSAQLIIAETVFGLGYGFFQDGRWPTTSEAIGCSLQMIGVALGIRAMNRSSAAKQTGKPQNAIA